MSLLVILYTSIMAICLGLAIVNFSIWLNQRNKYAYLLFSVSAVSAGTMALLDGIGIRISDPDQYLVFIKYYHIPVFSLLVSIVWFIHVYFGTGRKWLLYLITGLWLLCLIINFSTPHGLTFSSIDSIQQYSFFGRDTFGLPMGMPNPLRLIADFTSILILVFLVDASILQFRKGFKERAILVGGSTILFMLLAGIITPLSDIRHINLPSMISIPFTLILLSMSYELIKDVLRVPQLTNELSAKKRNWERLLNEINMIVVELDSGGNVLYVNPYYLMKTGYKLEEVIHKNWLDYFVPAADKKELKKSFSLPIRPDFPSNFQNNILTKQGDELTVYWSNLGIYDEEGNISALIGAGNDITEKEQAFKKILELSQKLEEENFVLKESMHDDYTSTEIVCKSQAAKYALGKANQVAVVDSSVLLEGETGVGKGLFARYIHDHSTRKKSAFIHLNCAAIPSELLESELFGYKKGAFTGAMKDKKGRFELADGGTLFMDEISELPLDLQPKILHVIQSGEFEPLGAEKTMTVNVRIIAATNKILSEELSAGKFREDLFYRLNVFPITIPPLRKRTEDIPELIDQFVRQFKKKYNKSITKVSKQTYESFISYSWPGNIRELQNVVERAIISSTGEILKTNGLLNADYQKSGTGISKVMKDKSLKLEEVEKEHIRNVLQSCKWRIHGLGGAAELLDINPSTLRSRMKKLNIDRVRN